MKNGSIRKEKETMYKKMSDFLEEGKAGDFSLEKFEVTDNDFIAKFRCGISNGTYIKLLHKGGNGVCILTRFGAGWLLRFWQRWQQSQH